MEKNLDLTNLSTFIQSLDEPISFALAEEAYAWHKEVEALKDILKTYGL